jgi:hypothetical protein
MADQATIKAALKSLLESLGLATIGAVIIDSRTAEDDPEVCAVIESQHPQNLCHGVNICLQRLNERESGNPCENIQTLGFKIETFRPYLRRSVDGVTSEAANAIAISELAALLRVTPNLGLDNRVRHLLLQSTDDMTLASVDGTGSDASLKHFGRFELQVENSVFV